jgi:Flp pilus assembly protein TadD
MHQDRLEEAAAELRRAVQLAPADAEAVNNLGLVLLRLKNYVSAIEVLERAVQINPNLIKAHNSLATAFQRAGRSAEAKGASRRATELTMLERNQGRSMILVQSAAQRLKSEDLESALAAAQEAVKLNPSFADGHQQLGLILARTGDASGAEAAFRRVLAIDRSRSAAHHEIGLIHEQTGRLASAIDEFREAVRLAPCSVGPREALARALAANGDTGQSRSEFQLLKSLDPSRETEPARGR